MARELNKNDLQKALCLCRSAFVSAGVFSFFINLLMLAPAFYMMHTFNRVLTSGSYTTLLMLTLILVFLLVTMGFLDWVRSRILVRVSSRMDNELSDKMFNISFKQALYSGGSISEAQPVKDLDGLRRFMTGNGFFAFFDAPWLPLYIAVMFMFSPWYGLMAVFAAVVLITFAILNERSTGHLFEDSSIKQNQANNMASAKLRNAEVIEAMGMLENIRDRWRRYAVESLYWQSVASDKAAGFSCSSKVFRMIVQSLILGLGALLVLEQKISPGAMIAGSILLGRALAPIDTLINSWRQFVTARYQYKRLNELLDKMPEEPDRMPLPAPSGEIKVEQAVIGPPKANIAVIKGLSFEIKPGEMIGLIGPSASGKSTLVRGILGVWPAMAGTVRLDGADINHYNRNDLGPFIGYLPQDIEIFDGTVSENIARFGEEDAGKVVEAARIADIHEMILQLPYGYDTQIGQGGSTLSGGQQQRIALARALYNKPVLVVLDEPNANLDEQGEVALNRTLESLKEQGVTIVVITHRSGILGLVDKIMVLAEGRLALYDSREKVQEKMNAANAGAKNQPPGRILGQKRTVSI